MPAMAILAVPGGCRFMNHPVHMTRHPDLEMTMDGRPCGAKSGMEFQAEEWLACPDWP